MLGDDPKDRTPKLDKADLRRIGVFRHLRSIPENACRKARVEFSVHTRSALLNHVFGHTGLADGDAQFEQLTLDVGRAPQRVVTAHLPDQIADLAGDRRSTWFSAAHFPRPEQAKALAMPRDNGLRPDGGQPRTPVLPKTRQDDP